MDERELNRTDEKEAEEMQNCRKNSKRKWGVLIAVILVVILVGGTIIGILYASFPKGYKDYVVQKEQYYVEFCQ